MKRVLYVLFTFLLALGLAVPALALGVSVDPHATMDGMSRSWYQGYGPTVKNHVMTLCLPLRAEGFAGDISASIALDDPNVFLLAAAPKTVTVSEENGVYPVKLTLSLEKSRRNGDYPATVTITGTDGAGQEITARLPYVLRIRDGLDSRETLEPAISITSSELNVGSGGSLTLTIFNPTTTLSATDGIITVTDAAGEILMNGSDRFPVPEILPGKSETVTIPMTVQGNASVSAHVLEVSYRYQVLEKDETWTERFTVPVTQSIRLEQGGVLMPTAIAGELSNMTLPLMNMGKGKLSNVLVKLEMDGVLDAQSVLVGTMEPGETKEAKLTFTPKPDSAGTHSGTVTVTCEDAYGNSYFQTLDVTLDVDAPIPKAELQPTEEKKPVAAAPIVLGVLCFLLAVGLVAQGVILTGRIHKLEEERL